MSIQAGQAVFLDQHGGLTASPPNSGNVQQLGIAIDSSNIQCAIQPFNGLGSIDNTIRIDPYGQYGHPLVKNADDLIKLVQANIITKKHALKIVFPYASKEELDGMLRDLTDDVILGDVK